MQDHAKNPFDDQMDGNISAKEARRLAGNISDMTLWRWIEHEIVPEPLYIRRRRYWRRREFIEALERNGRRA